MGAGEAPQVDGVAVGSATLLRTTWEPPRPPARLLRRPRIDALLDRGATASLTVVAGPPGSGKSVAVSSWLQGVDDATVWVSLDSACRDASLLWRYVVGGTQRATGLDLSDIERRLIAARGRAVIRALADLANRLAEVGPMVLVLDDLHAAASTSVKESLGWFVTHRPSNVRLVITTRSDPGVPLHRLRAHGELVEIRQPELRFALDEAAALLTMTTPSLPGADVERLVHLTEGWAVGLALAAQSLARAGRPGEVAIDFDHLHDNVADYLVHEVLQRLSESLRRFVLDTSVLETLEPEVCEALGHPDAERLLQQLVDAELFVVEVAGPQPVRRYHHLLRDVLRAFLRSTSPGRAEKLDVRAGEWFARRGDVAAAIGHSLAAGDHDAALPLMRDHALRFLDAGRSVLVATWAAAIPDAFVASDPARLAELAIVRIGADDPQGALDLTRRSAAIATVAPADARARGLGAAIRSYCELVIGEPAAAIDAANQALREVDEHGLDDPAIARCAPIAARAHAWNGDLSRAAAVLDRAAHPRSENFVMLAGAPAVRAVIDAAAGRLRDAASHAADVLAHTSGANLTHPAVLDARLTLAEVARARGDLGRADHELDAARDGAESPQRAVYAVRVALTRAEIEIARGTPGAALDTLDRARELLPGRPLPRGWSLWLDRAEALAHLAAGAPERSRRLLAGQPDGAAIHLLLARAHIASGDRPLARRSADAARSHATTVRERIDLALVDAALATDAADRDVALASALDLSAPDGHVQCFLDLTDGLRSSLPGLLVHRSGEAARAIARHLTSAAPGEPVYVGIAARLTERELEVLELLPSLLTTEEIAERLFVSRNTLKTHLRNLYGKFGVTSRRDAVERAVATGLLRPRRSFTRSG